MPINTKITDLTINTVKNNKVFEGMVSKGFINENELYLIEGESSNKTWYAICNTEANEQEKIINTATNSFELITGSVVHVLFTQPNDSINFSLKIDEIEAIEVYTQNIEPISIKWPSDSIISFVYDGEYYRIINGLIPPGIKIVRW